MPGEFREESKELPSEQPQEPVSESSVQEEVVEDLLTPDGKIDFIRTDALVEAFKKSLEIERDFNFRNPDSLYEKYDASGNYTDEYRKAVEVATKKLTRATKALFNTLDKSEDTKTNSNIFFTIKQLLSIAEHSRMELPPLKEAYNKIIENYPKIEECVNDGEVYPMELVVAMLRNGDDSQRKGVMDFISKNLPALEKYLMDNASKGNTEAVALSFNAMLLHGSETDKEYVTQILQKVLSDAKTAVAGTNVLGHMLKINITRGVAHFSKDALKQWDKDKEVMEVIKGNFLATLYHYGIDEETANTGAKEWTEPRTHTSVVVGHENLESFIFLETKQPGITKVLHEKYGIVDFGRYPIDMLIKQYENVDNKEDPYGVVMYPKDDYNGAFHQDRPIFLSLMDRLGDNPDLENYLIRVYECSSKKDIARALIDLDNTYGDFHKISFAIVGGHGTKDSIQFGNRHSRRNTLYSKDLHKKRVQKTGDFFEPGAKIILVSCSTGKNEGIGETLSKEFGMKVIAPTQPTSLRKISPKFVNGEIDFDVEYSKEGTEAVYEP